MKARDNPFSVERLHAVRYRTKEATFDEILQRLDEMNYRAAIVGPEGSGKTTLLGNLQDALTAAVSGADTPDSKRPGDTASALPGINRVGVAAAGPPRLTVAATAGYGHTEATASQDGGRC